MEEPNNLVTLWQNSVRDHADRPLFGVTNRERTGVDWSTYGEIDARVANCRGGLHKAGVTEGDSVGIIASNRPEWAITAFATYGLGARFVPMYEKELLKLWKYIIGDSEMKVLFVSTNAIYEQVKGLVDEIPTLERIYVIEDDGEGSLAALERAGAQDPTPARVPDPDQIAGLIYTSGTTGAPKGVLLSHGSFSYNAVTGSQTFGVLDYRDRSLSILPWAHSYGQTGELYNFIYIGGSIGFMQTLDTLGDDFALVKPTMLAAVPRLFNKIYDGIQAKMDEAGGLKNKLFTAAVANARTRRELARDGRSSAWVNLKHAVLDRLVFSKIRARFGGRLRVAFTASAVMNVDIADFFRDVGIPTYDAYGLTETAPCISMNTRAANRPGSVGRVLPGQRVVIDQSVIADSESHEDGEIVVYGPNIMQGYFKKPKETAAVMTAVGGFRTGDRGRVDADGYLYITGRIKEQYKLSNGKYVFPASMEEDVKLLPNVANAFVYGTGRDYNICLVVPDLDVLTRNAAKLGVLPASPHEVVTSSRVCEMLGEEITAHLRKHYGGYEVPRKYRILSDDFTLENGMLTQTMKLKRGAVVERYKDEIEAMYRAG